MRKLIILTLLFAFALQANAQSNQDKAKAYYFSAVEQYDSRNYSKALDYCQQVEDLLGSNNARLEALRVKSYFDKNEIQKAKTSLNTFLTLSPDESLLKEISPYIAKIDAAEEKQRKEKEVAERIAREKEEQQKEELRLAEEKRLLEEERNKEEQRLKEEKRIEYQRLVQEMQEELSKQSENAGKEQPHGNKEAQFVLDKYLAAAGANKAKSLISVSISSSSAMDGNPQVTQTEAVYTIDGKYKSVISSFGKEISRAVVNGKNGYTAADGKKYPIGAEFITSLIKPLYLRLFPEFELRNKPGVSMERIAEFDGRKAYIIKDENTSYYYDVVTNLKMGEVRVIEIPKQKPSLIILIYEDYKGYDGIKIPMLTVLNNGISVTHTKVTDIKFNEIYTDDDFR